jgi:isoleucyl-tRNA synthetase
VARKTSVEQALRSARDRAAHEDGVYLDGFDWLTGKNVTEVTDPIVEDLKVKGRFYRLDEYVHRYPVCWRCGTPLIFRLVDEWYISMDGLRQPMMDVTNNIRWIPDFGKERELDWLRNMHDWMISRSATGDWRCRSGNAKRAAIST